jgi:hypothetical protein
LSGGWIDNPSRTLNKNVFSGEKTCLRNLTISCKDDIPTVVPECQDNESPCLPEGGCIHGIYASAPVHIENVYVEKFLHDGIHIVGAECPKPVFIKNGIEVVDVVDCNPPDCQPVLLEDGSPYRAVDGNADGSYLENCSVGYCGRDGIHFSGGDAQTGLISCCSGVQNRRTGFYDATFGNTYIGCHSDNSPGTNYITEFQSNASVFINCWSEGEVKNIFHGPVTIISGKIGGDPAYMTDDSLPFILESGIAKRAPLGYKNSQGSKVIRSSFGDISTGANSSRDLNMVALSWGLLDGNSPDWNSTFVMRYFDKLDTAPNTRRDGWWVLVRGSATVGGENDMLRLPTKSADSRIQAPWFPNGIFIGDSDGGFTNVGFIGAKDIPTDNQRTYEQGDVIWNSEPSPGQPIGWVCIKSGTGTITSSPPVPSPAIFSTFGEVTNIGKSTVYDLVRPLTLADRYITVTQPTLTITLPASPVDGQTHSIKCKAGVATTTVNTSGGLKIDGEDSVTLGSSEHATFRYSDAAGVGEWERR